MAVTIPLPARLVVQGALQFCRPYFAFLYRFLQVDLGYDTAVIENYILPTFYYSYILCLLIVSDLTARLGHKRILVLQCLAGASALLLIVNGRGPYSFFMLQLSQVLQGIEVGLRTSFYCYVYYAIPDEVQQQKLVTWLYFASYLGAMTGDAIGQALFSNGTSISFLIYLTITLSLSCLPGILMLPSTSEDLDDSNEELKVVPSEVNKTTTPLNMTSNPLLVTAETDTPDVNSNDLKGWGRSTSNNVFIGSVPQISDNRMSRARGRGRDANGVDVVDGKTGQPNRHESRDRALTLRITSTRLPNPTLLHAAAVAVTENKRKNTTDGSSFVNNQNPGVVGEMTSRLSPTYTDLKSTSPTASTRHRTTSGLTAIPQSDAIIVHEGELPQTTIKSCHRVSASRESSRTANTYSLGNPIIGSSKSINLPEVFSPSDDAPDGVIVTNISKKEGLMRTEQEQKYVDGLTTSVPVQLSSHGLQNNTSDVVLSPAHSSSSKGQAQSMVSGNNSAHLPGFVPVAAGTRKKSKEKYKDKGKSSYSSSTRSTFVPSINSVSEQSSSSLRKDSSKKASRDGALSIRFLPPPAYLPDARLLPHTFSTSPPEYVQNSVVVADVLAATSQREKLPPMPEMAPDRMPPLNESIAVVDIDSNECKERDQHLVSPKRTFISTFMRRLSAESAGTRSGPDEGGTARVKSKELSSQMVIRAPAYRMSSSRLSIPFPPPHRSSSVTVSSHKSTVDNDRVSTGSVRISNSIDRIGSGSKGDILDTKDEGDAEPPAKHYRFRRSIRHLSMLFPAHPPVAVVVEGKVEYKKPSRLATIKRLYSNYKILCLSLWVITIELCVNTAEVYVYALFFAIDPQPSHDFSALTAGIANAASAFTCLLPGFWIEFSVRNGGKLALLGSFIIVSTFYFLSTTHSLFTAYVLFVSFEGAAYYSSTLYVTLLPQICSQMSAAEIPLDQLFVNPDASIEHETKDVEFVIVVNMMLGQSILIAVQGIIAIFFKDVNVRYRLYAFAIMSFATLVFSSVLLIGELIEADVKLNLIFSNLASECCSICKSKSTTGTYALRPAPLGGSRNIVK